MSNRQHILMLLLAAVIILFLLWLSGCSSKQTAVDLQYVNGCYFNVKGMTTEQSKTLEQEWNLNPPCDVKIENSSHQGQKK